MEIHDIIRKRRSVRSFTDVPIEEEKMTNLLEAAIWSPSAGNRHAWNMLVFQRKEEIEQIQALSPGMFGSPAAVIAFCADRSKALDKLVEGKRRLALSLLDTRTLMDISIAAQNICLEATELGLGSYMVGSFDQKAIKELLELPGDTDVELMVCLGYPKKVPKAPKRRTVQEATIRWIKTGGKNEK